MDLKLVLAILIGKTISYLNKLTGTGGTAAPGLYALKIDPDLVKKLTAKIENGSIIISGTNGKTTTSRLASDILKTKYSLIHNRQGSNLLRGIASTLISASSASGNIRANLALWEVDEATLPEAIENTNPKTIVLLNLFRDQLDRYGEVDTVRTKWLKANQGASMSQGATLILNADDPGVSILAKNFKGKTIFFGVNDKKINLPEITHVADIRHCLNCGSKLEYTTLLSAHMGHYKCSKCDFKRPTPNVFASELDFKSDFSSSLRLTINHSPLSINYNLPGLYNVYNVLAATALTNSFRIVNKTINQKIESFSAAFGRFQSVQIGQKSAIIFLIKNPAGANEVIRIVATRKSINILAILNDKTADGKDISWIWDTNWEILKGKTNSLSVSGTRAWDLATRLKYAGFKLNNESVHENISSSIYSTVKNLDTKDTLLILTTYTALLEVQDTLAKLGSPKWHEQ